MIWEPTKLKAVDAGKYDDFGWEVAIDGNVLAVAAPQSSVYQNPDYYYPGSGKVYVFELDGAS